MYGNISWKNMKLCFVECKTCFNQLYMVIKLWKYANFEFWGGDV